jgi:hypothetical protein
MDDPHAVLKRFFGHMMNQAWQDAGALFSESAIAAMKRGWDGAAAMTLPIPRKWTDLFLDFSTDDEVLAASGLELVASFLARHDQRNAVRLSLEGESSLHPELVDHIRDAVEPFRTPRVLGTVFDGADEAFVVCRMGEGSVEGIHGADKSFPGQPKVFLLRREAEGWRLVDIVGATLNPGFGVAMPRENPGPGIGFGT